MARLPRRYVVPEVETEIYAGGTKDGIYIRGSTIDDSIDKTKFIMTNSTGRAGIMHDNTTHLREIVEDVIIKDARMWGLRRYGLIDSITRRVLVRNVLKEHGDYSEAWGNATWEDFTAIQCAAQGFQLRLTNNRLDTHWGVPKIINLTRLTLLECGKEIGAGRAGFSLSVKDQGPEAVVTITDPVIQTIKQTAVAKRSDGTMADSFGGMCVEYCKELKILGGYVEMKNPEKEAVQLFNYSDSSATRTGPDNILVENLTVARNGNICVREGDGSRIEIKDCRGTGKIKIFVRGNDNIWRLNRSLPIAQGYLYVR